MDNKVKANDYYMSKAAHLGMITIDDTMKVITKAYSSKDKTLKFYKEELQRFDTLIIVFADYTKGFKTLIDGVSEFYVGKTSVLKPLCIHDIPNDTYTLTNFSSLVASDAFKNITTLNISQNIITTEDYTKPEHYKTANGQDVIDFCESYELDFTLGNVVKYVCRAGKKENNSAKQDLLKAKEYIERKLKMYE